MSVDKRRLAAAQRTAALRTPSTTKRLCAWIIIVPALALFSFSVVAGAAGFGAKPDLAAAAARVTPKHADDHGAVVVVGRRRAPTTRSPAFSGRASATRSAGSQAASSTRVSASYRTRRRRSGSGQRPTAS